MYTYEALSAEDTYYLGVSLGRKLKGGEVIALEGELGAGKTLFVKGLAAGLEAEEQVTSPTFTLLHLYEGRLQLAHFDVYRLPCPEAIEELGYEEYFYGQGVTAVEWSDLITAYLPEEYLAVKIQRFYASNGQEGRVINLFPHGDKIENIIKELQKDVGLRNR